MCVVHTTTHLLLPVADLGISRPLSVQLFFFFMQFSAKIKPNNRLATPSLLGNPGSAAGYKNIEMEILQGNSPREFIE